MKPCVTCGGAQRSRSGGSESLDSKEGMGGHRGCALDYGGAAAQTRRDIGVARGGGVAARTDPRTAGPWRAATPGSMGGKFGRAAKRGSAAQDVPLRPHYFGSPPDRS